MDRERVGVEGERLGSELTARGVRVIALTLVDNAGITRVKAIPVNRLGHVAEWGVGMSPVADVYLVDDSTTTSAHVGGPVGDLRLYPDLERLVPLAAQPGWAWAPVDRFTQDGEPYPCCQRGLARAAVAGAAARGLTARMAFEVEWFVGLPDGSPAGHGPAYGMAPVVELFAYLDDLISMLAVQGVPVDQCHPEYSPGQFEVSVAAADPVAAADRTVLVRQTIRAVSLAHGLRVSFAPVVVAGQVGNGQHLHFSAHLNGRPALTGGDGPRGLTAEGEAILAGVLRHLPGLTALGAPSVSSYLRLVPQRWAGPYQCWGLENREAALRLVTGCLGERDRAANAELKCCDGSGNPYLIVAGVTAVAAASLGTSLSLPPEVGVDPASLAPEARPARLPATVAEAVAALRADELLAPMLGDPLLEAFCAVREAEARLFEGATEEEIVAASRWRY